MCLYAWVLTVTHGYAIVGKQLLFDLNIENVRIEERHFESFRRIPNSTRHHSSHSRTNRFQDAI